MKIVSHFPISVVQGLLKEYGHILMEEYVPSLQLSAGLMVFTAFTTLCYPVFGHL